MLETDPIPPGWYPDPNLPNTRRYWNGTAWTRELERAKRRLPKLNGLTLTWAYIGACSVPIIGYVAGVMAARRRQRVHAIVLWIVATVSLLVYLSTLSTATY